MSLQKIGKYTEIFECSRKLQRPTAFDEKRVTLIQNIAIAGLIESGVPYTAENGEIIIDTGIDYKSVFINDIFQYLSPEFQMKVMVENAKIKELPAPQNINYQDIRPETVHQDIRPETVHWEEVFNSKGVRKAEIKKEPMKMMEGLEDYEPENTVTTEYETEQRVEITSEEDLINKKWENVNAQTEPVTIPSQQMETPELNNNEQAVSEKPIEEKSAVPAKTPVENASIPDNFESPDNIDVRKEESEYPEADVMELSKYGITYERCNLEVIKGDGSIVRFSVHAAPLKGNNWDVIIVRLKQTGENGGYIHTECGVEPEFIYGDLSIKARKNNNSVFSCDFYSDDSSIKINKKNIENGGNQGNLVIFDDNLEIRIYPFPNVRNKETGKMEFGNNKRGEAAFLYYIENGEEVISSSGAERPAQFDYEGERIAIRAKWEKEKIIVGAEVVHNA